MTKIASAVTEDSDFALFYPPGHPGPLPVIAEVRVADRVARVAENPNAVAKIGAYQKKLADLKRHAQDNKLEGNAKVNHASKISKTKAAMMRLIKILVGDK
jgi:hypothetical protein